MKEGLNHEQMRQTSRMLQKMWNEGPSTKGEAEVNDIQEVMMQTQQQVQQAEMRGRMFVLKTLMEDRELSKALCRSPKYQQLLLAKPLQDYLLADNIIKDSGIDVEIKEDTARLQQMIDNCNSVRPAIELEGQLAASERKLRALLELCDPAILRTFIMEQQ